MSKGVMCVYSLIMMAAMGVTAAVAQGQGSAVVYYPGTKNYYQLVEYPTGQGRNWWQAEQEAESWTYKGVRGRLAVVSNRDLEEFLRNTFAPKVEAWIGLRYWCNYRKLQWVTGELHPQSAYSNWHPNWNRDPSVSCGSGISYMPVYYTGRASGGFLWQAAGEAKVFESYFVEYPTGAQ